MNTQTEITILSNLIVVERAVLYARVSGDDRSKDGRNLSGQLDMCREYAQNKGYQVVKEMQEDDRGASGYETDLPKLNQIREMARNSEFEILIVRELDRLSRNLAKQLAIEKELEWADVRVEYVLTEYDDTAEGRLQKHIRATIAEYEREKIRERLSRGKWLKLKFGQIVSNRAPYGYNLIRENDRTYFEIYEPEAEIVRIIFEWYTSEDDENGRMSIKAIARKLCERGIPTAADTGRTKGGGPKKKGRNEWTFSTIYQILKNETYIGKWQYYKRKMKDGKRLETRPEERLTVEVPPIIDQATWNKAQARFAENKAKASRNKKYEYLLSGHVICGLCGMKMSGVARGKKIYKYYLCPARYKSNNLNIAHECICPTFRVDWVDTVVWQKLVSYLSDPEALTKALNEYQAEKEKINAPFYERLATIESLLNDNKTQLAKLIDLYLGSDEMTKTMLLDRKKRLTDTVEALDRERVILVKQIQNIGLGDEDIKTLQAFALSMGQDLRLGDDDIEMKRGLIDILEVKVTLTVENNQKVIYLTCAIPQWADVLSVKTVVGI